MYALKAHELYRFFHVGDDEVAALRGVSFHLEFGEILAFMGPSGSGKSTLLSCVTGLDEPDGGYVDLGGVRLTRRSEAERAAARRSNFGIMLQSENLFPHLTVEENLKLPLSLRGRSRSIVARDLLGLLGLGHCRQALPTELSGGEAARTGLAVALITDPPILVADEPTAEVDRGSEARLIEVLRERRQRGRATLLATHSVALASVADRVITLRDGRATGGDGPGHC
jgi:putative ABC transport system ATP-binding protein